MAFRVREPERRYTSGSDDDGTNQEEEAERRYTSGSDEDGIMQEEEEEERSDASGDENGEKQDDEIDEYDQPVWTFRVLSLGSVTCIFLLILNKFFLHRTAECIMSMVSANAVTYVLGYIMARALPKRTIYWRSFGLEFYLNPGPFSMREYVLISIFANTGAAYGGITSYTILRALSSQTF